MNSYIGRNIRNGQEAYVAEVSLTAEGRNVVGVDRIFVTYVEYLQEGDMWLVHTDNVKYLLSKQSMLGIVVDKHMLDLVNNEKLRG